MIADRAGVVTPFAMINLQERGSFFVQPTSEVYEGMIVGENSRADDMEVNITKEKKLTNMRAASSDTFENLTPPRNLTLEESLAGLVAYYSHDVAKAATQPVAAIGNDDRSLRVSCTRAHGYDIEVAPGLLERLPKLLRQRFAGTKMVVLTDESIEPVYGSALIAGLEGE